MAPSKQIDQLLEEHAVLVRDKNHLVFRLSDGQTFVRSKTPSDYRSDRNNLAELKPGWDCPAPAAARRALGGRRKSGRMRELSELGRTRLLRMTLPWLV